MENLLIKPTRVIVDDGGLGTTPEIAESQYGITPDIVFIRNDGWSLGAPFGFEGIAYRMWSDSWTRFCHRGDTQFTPISKYIP